MAAFVKFSRGLISQYEALGRNNKIDNDTLYLVYEDTSSETGQLYLGNKLISSTNISSINLSDISDINMPEKLEDGMLLQYNQSTVPGESGRWEAKPLTDVLSEYEGTSTEAKIPVVSDLDTIENPHKDDIAVQGKELFIYDGEKWEPLTVSDLENKISALEEKVGQEKNNGQPATGLYKKIDDLRDELDVQIDSKIANAQHLRYQVVSNLADIHLDNEEETKNTVFLVPKNDASADDGYDEYLVNDKKLERLGSWTGDLTGYIQEDDNRLLSDEQKQKLDSLGYDSEKNQAIITASQVSDLQDFLNDNSYIRDVEAGVFSVDENGKLGLVSVPSDALTNYISTPYFNSTVGDINQIIDHENGRTLVDEINTIKTSVTWQELPQ